MKKTMLFLSMIIILSFTANAQGWLNKVGAAAKDAAKRTVEKRVEEKAEEVTDKALDKAEDAVTKSKKTNKKQTDETTGNIDEQINEKQQQQQPKQKLTSITQYDFVPGDKILFFEDFSEDAIGDFPALWTTNGSGEVKTVSIAPGKWLHMNGKDAVYCYTKEINFPENFIVEFDIIPDKDFQFGTCLTLYQDNPERSKEVNDDLYPGLRGLHISPNYEGWETKGYDSDKDWLIGTGAKNPLVAEELNHVIVWIQKRRVRIYHQGQKVLDVPTNIYAETKLNKMLFSGWDRNSTPYVTNIKVTTASSDTRSKLITEGKLVTYGITFDVNKADIKSESFGTLKGIAGVLAENPDVNVKIIGHTDGDGDDAKNMDLSKRRAESVKNELVKNFGIDSSRLTTEGAGETKPIVANDTPVNKARNRRVEIIKL